MQEKCPHEECQLLFSGLHHWLVLQHQLSQCRYRAFFFLWRFRKAYRANCHLKRPGLAGCDVGRAAEDPGEFLRFPVDRRLGGWPPAYAVVKVVSSWVDVHW